MPFNFPSLLSCCTPSHSEVDHRTGKECFTLGANGKPTVMDLPEYQVVEQDAANLLKRDIPTTVRGCVEYILDCARFIKAHGAATDTRILPDVERRNNHLLAQAQRASSSSQAAAAAMESQSLVCSLALRAGPPNAITIGVYDTRPGNVVEMKDMMRDDAKRARSADAIKMDHPKAMARMSALYDAHVDDLLQDPCFMPRRCPAPEALIEAAQQGQPFNSVLARMI